MKQITNWGTRNNKKLKNGANSTTQHTGERTYFFFSFLGNFIYTVILDS
jgi:hypothetical protein